ncbi:MAG: hypothetical protein FWC50_16295, partial [Planctomycetaceae bacterium]|nr:hypothetical protein [Planctomycetaceae bacterium]
EIRSDNGSGIAPDENGPSPQDVAREASKPDTAFFDKAWIPQYLSKNQERGNSLMEAEFPVRSPGRTDRMEMGRGNALMEAELTATGVRGGK